MNRVERVSDSMFTVNGQLAEVVDGEVGFTNGTEMDFYQYRAICEFIDDEEQNLRILARKSVKKVLKELCIPTEDD